MNKSFIISGSGGQGILSIGSILANIFMLNGYYVTYCSSYGAEMRGGADNCEIIDSEKEINSFQKEKEHYVITLNQASYNKFIHKVKENGFIIANSSLISKEKLKENINYIFAPFSEIATKLGNIKMANSVALGLLTSLIENFNKSNIKKGYEKVLHNKTELIQKNIEAYNLGFEYKKEEI